MLRLLRFLQNLLHLVPATEVEVQQTVHKLEEGEWKHWTILALVIAQVAAICTLWFYSNSGFAGLSHPRAIEQAVIAREIARGNGFTTKVIRPAAIWQSGATKANGVFAVDRLPDSYHAPLWPYILAPGVWMARSTWEMTDHDIAYVCDKIVAGAATLFFILSCVVNYFIARRLFDQRLASLGVLLVLICERCWYFALTGLPQMLLLFLFSLATYMLLRAIEAHCALNPEEDDYTAQASVAPISFGDGQAAADPQDEQAPLIQEAGLAPHPETHSRFSFLNNPLPWLLGVAATFGMLALGHALTVWIFAGALLFCGIYFPHRLRNISLMGVVFAAIYAPWLYHNFTVFNHDWKGLGGLAWFSGLDGLGLSEDTLLRSVNPPLLSLGVSAFPSKAFGGINDQIGSIVTFLGSVVVAPIFFVALLHSFKRREVAVFRWAILILWIFALLGMAVFGLHAFDGFAANDLHLLFIPLMTFYGLAFILTLWSRLPLSSIRLVHIGFVVLLFLLSGRPYITMVIRLLGPMQSRFKWPPYVPPYIAIMRGWTTDKEIIMSDMPWAVAWYADRKSLWMPTTIKEFTDLNDYRKLNGEIVGLYLTPYSGDQPFLNAIEKGDYKDWAPFITRTVNLRNLPFHAVTALPIDNQCIVYFDRDRWTARED